MKCLGRFNDSIQEQVFQTPQNCSSTTLGNSTVQKSYTLGVHCNNCSCSPRWGQRACLLSVLSAREAAAAAGEARVKTELVLSSPGLRPTVIRLHSPRQGLFVERTPYQMATIAGTRLLSRQGDSHHRPGRLWSILLYISSPPAREIPTNSTFWIFIFWNIDIGRVVFGSKRTQALLRNVICSHTLRSKRFSLKISHSCLDNGI